MASLLSHVLACSAIVVVLAFGTDAKANIDPTNATEQDRESKMAAVNKALEMLEELKAQVLEEGELEAATYNKFACFCKDTTHDRLKSIEAGEDEQTTLSSSIGSLGVTRDNLDKKIKNALASISSIESDIKQEVEQRQKTFKVYTANIADLDAGLKGLEKAIMTVKASKSASFVQLKTISPRISQTVRTATLLADALGLGSPMTQKMSTLFLQGDQAPANEVQMEDYKYHSDDIIKTLEVLKDDFQKKKSEVDAAEVDSVRAHDRLMQARANAKKIKNSELEKAREDKSQTMVDIDMASQQLSTVEATLLEDKQYTKKLQKMCADKATTWDQRTQARSNELSTLTQAIGIIGGAVQGNISTSTLRLVQQGVGVRMANVVAVDADSMNALEAETEDVESSAALAQVASKRRGMLRASVKQHPASNGRDLVVSLLKSQGKDLHSTLLTSLASKIAADPFSKVKQLIQELIERLLKEASNEANQKGWCDKATADAKWKRDNSVGKIASLNSQSAKFEADRDRLAEELIILSTDISELRDARSYAVSNRTVEKAQNEATVDEAREGLSALNTCIDLLDKFYKTVSKETVSLSLAQVDPLGDAPATNFDLGEAYTGAQSAAGGILGMLDVMKSDFIRTVSETQKAEALAEQDHLEFMTESGKALAQKQEAESAKNAQKSDVDSKHSDTMQLLESQSNILQGALKELQDLKPVCITTGMTYKDRVSNREEEIESLNKALCILDKYEQYGPDGTGEC